MSLLFKRLNNKSLLAKNLLKLSNLKPICTTRLVLAENQVPEFEHRPEFVSKKLKKYLEEEKKYDGKLVYVGQLSRQLKSAKFLSLSSSVLGIALLPLLTDTLSSSSLFAQLFVFGTSGFFIFVTPLFSQFLGRRYVSRMYYNYEQKKFKAVLFSFLMYEYKLEFDLSDVYVPDMPGPFTTVKLKSNDRNLFIDLNSISDVELTQRIFGYDKPFDIKKYTKQD